MSNVLSGCVDRAALTMPADTSTDFRKLVGDGVRGGQRLKTGKATRYTGQQLPGRLDSSPRPLTLA